MQDYERDNILEQYEIAVNSTRKDQGAILCSTDKGVFLMREVGVSERGFLRLSNCMSILWIMVIKL